jgi:hypothetical protein
MAIGKISGPMLQTNLERQGVDLAIDTDVVYFDVTNKRLGVNTGSPSRTLDVNGNASIAEIQITGNTITSTNGKLNLGSIDDILVTGGMPNYLVYTDGAGNLSFGNLDLLSGVEGFTANFIELGSNTVGSFSNSVVFTENMSVTNALSTLNLELGNVTGQVQELQREVYANANVASYLPIYGGEVLGSDITALNYFNGNINTDIITPYETTSTVFAGNTGIGLPVGNNSNRPAGFTGQTRFNTDLSVIEFFNGTDWIPVTNSITDQQIEPDGISQSYSLNKTSTSAGVIVSINGTVQTPGLAYTCSGTTITFAEVPQVSDYIDIRFIATAVTTNDEYETIGTSAVTVGTGLAIVDSFSSTMFRSAKYTISSSNSDAQFYEVMVTQYGGTVSISTTANLRTGSNYITFTSNVNGSDINLLAQSNASPNSLRIKRVYFTV